MDRIVSPRPGALLVVLAVTLSTTLLAWLVGPIPVLAVGVALLAGWTLVLRPALATGLAIFLLYTNLPVVIANRTSSSQAVSAVVIALFLPAIARELVLLRKGLHLDRTFALMMVFLAIMLFSGFTAVGQETAIRAMLTYVSEGLLIYLAVTHAVRDPRALRMAVDAVLVAACLLAALALYQAISGDYRQQFLGLAQRGLEKYDPLGAPADQMALADRARGPVDDPNRFAQILLMAAPLAAVSALSAGTRGGRRIYLVAAGILAGGVVITYSRGAFLAMAVLAFIASGYRLVRLRHVAAAATVGSIVVVLALPGYAGRVSSITNATALFGPDASAEPDGATRGRTTVMLAALLAFREHPLLGVGPGQYMPFYSVQYQTRPEISLRALPTPRRAHNLYLEMAAEIGAFGLLTFVAIPALLLLDLLRLHRRWRDERPELAHLAAGFSLMILAYLGTGMFLHLAYARYYWFAIALTSSAVFVLRTYGTPAPLLGKEG